MALRQELDDLVKAHAKYDPAVRLPADSELPREPLYLQALKAQAARDGVTVAEVFARDQKLLAESEYPSPQCLKPGDVTRAVVGLQALPVARQAHLEACLYCQALVAHSRPDEARIARIRTALARPEAVPTAEPVWRRARAWIPSLDWSSLWSVKELVPAGVGMLLGIGVMLGWLSLKSPRTQSAERDKVLLHSAVYNLWRGDNPAAAAAQADQLLKQNPGNAEAFRVRAGASVQLGEWQKAQSDYAAALRLDPNDSISASALDYLKRFSGRKNDDAPLLGYVPEGMLPRQMKETKDN